MAINSAASHRAYMARTGLTRSGARIWTADEIAILRERYPDYAAAQRLLPHRTMRAIQQKAVTLGITTPRRSWREGDVSRLKPRYPTREPVQVIAEDLGRRKKAVWDKASKLRIRRPRRRPSAVDDPLVHSIRQRAFDLHISIKELDDEAGGGTYFRRPTKKRNWRAITKALRCLGGELVIEDT
jgi:hypothetical protein